MSENIFCFSICQPLTGLLFTFGFRVFLISKHLASSSSVPQMHRACRLELLRAVGSWGDCAGALRG